MKIGNPADKPNLPLVASQKPTPDSVSDVKSNPIKVGPQSAPIKAGPEAAPISLAPEGSPVALSSTASSLLAGSSGAEFDAAKVAKVSASIAAGTFKIDAGAIADKLISNAQELLTKAGS